MLIKHLDSKVGAEKGHDYTSGMYLFQVPKNKQNVPPNKIPIGIQKNYGYICKLFLCLNFLIFLHSYIIRILAFYFKARKKKKNLF